MVSHSGARSAGAGEPNQRRATGRAAAEATEGPARWSDPSRAIAFSDGVFAIIITLLVLDLVPPEWPPGQLLASLVERWPTYAAYLAFYFLVGVAWLNHAAVFRHIRWMNRGLQWSNLAVLLRRHDLLTACTDLR